MKNRSPFFVLPSVGVLLAASVFYVSAQSNGIELNKRPLRDIGEKLRSDIDSKKVDLSGPFLVEMNGTLDHKGNIDLKSSTFTRTEGDPALVEAIKSGILAVSDAGYFSYFKPLGSNGFLLVVEQTASDFQGRFSTEFETATRAQSIRSMAQLLVAISRDKKQEPNATEADRKDLVLLNGVTVQSEDKSVIILIKAPAEQVQKLIADHLALKSANGQ